MNRPGWNRSCSERLFVALLVLFPPSFRNRFGQDMRELFRDQLREARHRAGRRGIWFSWLRTMPSFLRAALLERLDTARARRARRAPPRTQQPGSDAMLATLADDLRYSGRMLRKSPTFTLVAVLVISLGTGAVTTVASAINSLLLRPLPGAAEPERLVSVERVQGTATGEALEASHRYYEHLRGGSRTVEDLAAWSTVDLTVATGGHGLSAHASIVSANYFEVLGVRPVVGRLFTADDEPADDGRPVIVISEGFWRSRLGGDPSVVGRVLRVNGRPYSLSGVAPAEFRGVFTPVRTDAWVPLAMQTHLRPARDPAAATPWLRTFGRLADGASPGAARQELSALTSAWVESGAEPDTLSAWSSVRLAPMTGLPTEASGPVASFMGLLLAAAVLVLLIGSVDVAAMLSARAVTRRREMAVRTALGAGRGRLVRQLLTETVLLFLGGAVGGVLLALEATRALARLPLPGDVPVSLDLAPDVRVLAFALAVALLTGLVFGLAPALNASRRDVAMRLRDGSATSGARSALTSKGLVLGQLAACLLLLIAAGLFLRALDRGRHLDPGFDPEGVATVALDPQAWGYGESETRAFYRSLREEASALPGVEAVSYAGFLPLAGGSSNGRIRLDGVEGTSGEEPGEVAVQLADVGVDYFSVLRIPILRGRPFRPADGEEARRVAVVNQTLARRAFPDGDALGSTFRFRGEQVTIVGIARDAKYFALNEETPSFVYFPSAQLWRPAQTLMVRTATEPGALGGALDRAIHRLEPSAPRSTLVTLEQATAVALLPQRVAAVVTGGLGAAGLLLAAVGLYGILAFSVSQRRKEIGVRMALGARRRDVLRLITGQGVRLAASGVVVGLVLAAGASRLMERFLFGVSPLDGVTYAGTSVLMLAVAFFASFLPARQAAGADPMSSLSSD